MRFNNAKVKRWIPIAYFLIFLLIVYSLVGFNLKWNELGSKGFVYMLPAIVLFLGAILLYVLAVFFEYDSDGDVLNFINRGMFVTDFFNYRENKAEFPKEKLAYYKLNDYLIYSSLNIYIRSKNNRIKRLKFNVSFLSRKKKRSLRKSLDKVVRNNKKSLNGSR